MALVPECVAMLMMPADARPNSARVHRSGGESVHRERRANRETDVLPGWRESRALSGQLVVTHRQQRETKAPARVGGCVVGLVALDIAHRDRCAGNGRTR